ncbi:MAG: flavodoxin-dependent (E)-4-hydroxy-3-methylbut-2-enyl-diphosphate synthase [Candidatus Adiutrix sp.]|jgi:(E)-4-hydroxy-3-methylbut-2-enyl-diphosphate synthase|nr:flavodoxin-dependent (E)-4-hydroxy-3-methylbut-2-enyl-diphosphate synthase [Candidatus Adiutrix sp.]
MDDRPAGLFISASTSARITRSLRLGSVRIGGGAPVAVQTMTDTDPRDAAATLAQIRRVALAGAEIVRLAVPDERAADTLKEIVPDSPVPLVADIHFDWRLAIKAAEAGAAGLRINPGNIGGPEKVRAVAEAAGRLGAVIRVGVNGGSLEKRVLARHGGRVTAEGLVESALNQVRLLEETGFHDLKVSLKGSDVPETVAAARRWSEVSDIPQHIGITEAGDALTGAVKSAVGLGLILAGGLGDTLRVSLTAPPEDEVRAAWAILRALGLRARGVEVISCPTCGRTEGPVARLAEEVRRRLADLTEPLQVAVMGCVVNGPGEARQADAGLALGRGHGLIFAGGRRVAARVPCDRLAEALEDEVRRRLSRRPETGEAHGDGN